MRRTISPIICGDIAKKQFGINKWNQLNRGFMYFYSGPALKMVEKSNQHWFGQDLIDVGEMVIN